MKAALILIAMLAVTGLILYLLDKWDRDDRATTTVADDDHTEASSATAGCADAACALHDSCAGEQLLRGACSDKIEYFDDEELDAFIGRDPDTYTDGELEQFRDVLYTLQKHEILLWHQSITRRGITIPEDLYRELLNMAE